MVQQLLSLRWYTMKVSLSLSFLSTKPKEKKLKRKKSERERQKNTEFFNKVTITLQTARASDFLQSLQMFHNQGFSQNPFVLDQSSLGHYLGHPALLQGPKLAGRQTQAEKRPTKNCGLLLMSTPSKIGWPLFNVA